LKITSFLTVCSLCLLTSCARHIVRSHFGAPPPAEAICSAPGSNTSPGLGSLSGEVLDPTGAVIPNAAVSTYAQGVIHTVRTCVNGAFTFNDLPFGVYSISVDMPDSPRHS
jgi:hypothetical protein